jgi:hypothetical protein
VTEKEKGTASTVWPTKGISNAGERFRDSERGWGEGGREGE